MSTRRARRNHGWSQRRQLRRRRYDSYTDSEAWYRRRKAWAAAWSARSTIEPTCVVCGAAWTLEAGHLHHRSYRRLGHEAFEDLLPVCRRCHLALHEVWDVSPTWRRLGQRQATDGIIAALRRTRRATKERDQ